MRERAEARTFTDKKPENNLQFLPTAWQLDTSTNPYGPEVLRIIEAERQVPVTITADTSLRPKVIDSCGMTCKFCHNEGTPVASDNRGRVDFLGTGISGRVSIFTEKNGVDFLPGVMLPNRKFIEALALMRDSLGLDEIHLSGGEPTLNNDLPQLMRLASNEGYTVKMTSNGERPSMIDLCAGSGLAKINFSIFGTTPQELAEVQNSRFNNVNLASAKLRALHRSIAYAINNGIEVGANIVMSDLSHAERVRRVLDEFEPQLSVRILPDLEQSSSSHFAIYKFLADLDAEPTNMSIDAGSSNARVKYQLPDGREVHFKQIRPVRPPDTCSDCSLNNPDDCKEGYYGIRLYVDEQGGYKVGVCLQRMDLTMPIEEFIGSGIYKDIATMRLQEFENLTAFYGV